MQDAKQTRAIKPMPVPIFKNDVLYILIRPLFHGKIPFARDVCVNISVVNLTNICLVDYSIFGLNNIYLNLSIHFTNSSARHF